MAPLKKPGLEEGTGAATSEKDQLKSEACEKSNCEVAVAVPACEFGPVVSEVSWDEAVMASSDDGVQGWLRLRVWRVWM